MKKRGSAALLAALALLLALLLPTGGQAASTVYFTAVNDTLLELSDATMPFWSGGTLYVPASAFSGGVLNVTYSYNTGKETLILTRSGVKLICNLNTELMVDNQGNIYDYNAIERGGTVFLPVNLVCGVLGVTCTTRSIPYGYLVRIRDDGASYTDEGFVSAASSMLASRYAAYEAAHTETAAPAPDENESAKTLYLAFLVTDADTASSWLDALDKTDFHATFFLTQTFLKTASTPEGSELLRRILASGHNLGLQTATAGSEAALQELRQDNELLQRAAFVKTRLVLLSGGTAQRNAAVRAGFCPARFDLDYTDSGFSSLTQASAALAAATGSRVQLGSAAEPTALSALLSQARGRSYACAPLRETAY